ncbi:MAG: hypothetical protein WCF44_05515 [Candidatus Methylophosphatis roskildensis]
MKGWYLKRGGIKAGPFSATEIEILFEQRKIRPGDQIRQSGSREWILAEQFANPESTDAPVESPLAVGEAACQPVAGTPQRDTVRADDESRPAPVELPPEPSQAPARLSVRLSKYRRLIADGMVTLGIVSVVALLLWQIDYDEIFGLPTMEELAVGIGLRTSGPAPAAMRDDLVIDFGAGQGIKGWFNNGSWAALHALPSVNLVGADIDHDGVDDMVIDFGPEHGIWVRPRSGTWRKLHDRSTARMVRIDLNHNGHDDLVVDFGKDFGSWAYLDDARWQSVHGTTAGAAIAADLDNNGQDDLVVDFGPPHGIWAYMNDSKWLPIHGESTSGMLRADLDTNGRDDLVVDFGPKSGIWVLNDDSKWTPLHGQSASGMTAVDIDHNGQDDLVIDFGPSHGIWIWLNNTAWKQLHGVSARQIVAADLDGNRKADLVVDFGSSGIWCYMNGSDWYPLGAGGVRMLAGEFDGR